MRAMIAAILVAAAAVAGFFVYRNNAAAPQQGMFATTPTPPQTTQDCTASNAAYQYNEDQRLRLVMRRVPSNPAAGPEFANGVNGHQIGNMMFVVQVTSTGAEYVFTPVNRNASGPAYEAYVLYVHPQAGGEQMPVQLFDADMHLINDMPRDDSPAPHFIIMPDLMRRLYADHIDFPTGAFRFFRCERPASQAAPTP